MSAWFETGSCYIIAEIGVNHDGDVAVAREMIDVAADAGADAVKFQTFSADRLVTADARKASYQDQNDPRAGESQHAMLQRLELSEDELIACREHCLKRDIEFLSTPFDEDSADLLMDVGVKGFKVSSGDLTNIPLLEHLARKGLPIIVSTGMGDMDEVREAVEAIRAAGNPPLALLHCVSNYPAAPEDCNLSAIDTLARAFEIPVGWSDHTLGDTIALAAIARGASILEKHYTLDTNRAGPDHKASLMPEELKALITGIRTVEAAIGDGIKQPKPSEMDTAKVARRSLVAARDIKPGEAITAEMITRKRPGTGLKPNAIHQVLGRKAKNAIAIDTLIGLEDLA